MATHQFVATDLGTGQAKDQATGQAHLEMHCTSAAWRGVLGWSQAQLVESESVFHGTYPCLRMFISFHIHRQVQQVGVECFGANRKDFHKARFALG